MNIININTTCSHKKSSHGLLKITPSVAACVMALTGGMSVKAQQLAEAESPDTTSSFQLEEVIVTALKKEESLQEVSVGIAVLDAEQLDNHHIVNIKDIQAYVPSLTVNDSFGTAQISSRGLGLSSVSAGIDPAVGLYVDGAVINSPIAQLFSLFDLQRVEVLRGPQGSLFGRNTMAGAVELITAKPGEEFEAYASVNVGNYSLVETAGAISGPLNEALLGRVAWRTIARDGFGKNEFTGADVDDLGQRMMRGHLEFAPSSNFNFLLTGEYARQDDKALVFKLKEETFADLPNKRSPGIGGFPTGDERNISTEFDPRNDRETWAVTGTSIWYINDNLTNKNIFNYRKVDVTLI